jgi:hypothetical protein
MVTVMLSSGRVTKTVVYADSVTAAKELASMLYTAPRVISQPIEVKL